MVATLPDLAPVLAIGGGWALRPIDEPLDHRRTSAHGYAASRGDGDVDGPEEFRVRVQRVRHHPLRACYPYGAHDFVVWLDGHGDHAPELLRALTSALFAADARCRRVIAAPDEYDVDAQRVLTAGGFCGIAEVDLPGGSIVLFAAEPPDLAELSTALDDMPH